MQEEEMAGCSGKQSYRNVGDIVFLNFRRFKGHPYKCQFCGFWHVGNTLHMSIGKPEWKPRSKKRGKR